MDGNMRKSNWNVFKNNKCDFRLLPAVYAAQTKIESWHTRPTINVICNQYAIEY